jgi:hypothetical protein
MPENHHQDSTPNCCHEQLLMGWKRGAMRIENTRGMQNPQGKVEGYMRVGVRVQELLPLTHPYPWGGYVGVGKGMDLLSGPMFSKQKPAIF